MSWLKVVVSLPGSDWLWNHCMKALTSINDIRVNFQSRKNRTINKGGGAPLYIEKEICAAVKGRVFKHFSVGKGIKN